MYQSETERVRTVERFLSLEISKEKELQEIVSLAAQICNVPTALITFVDNDTQHIRFKHSFAADTTKRTDAFCNHAIEQHQVLVIPDALSDERFRNNPLVTGNPNIRFYAGAPLSTKNGYNLGSLCVIDQEPGTISEIQQQMLQALSKQVMQLLEFDECLQMLKKQLAEAEHSEIELRSFFESSTENHLLLGKEFEILAFNKALETYTFTDTGLKLERGKLMTPYIQHDEAAEIFYQDYLKALNGTAVFVQRQVKLGTKYFWRLIKFEPAFNREGKIIGVSVNSTDVTEKIEHEQTVHSQNESLKEIAFIQSHELRRPVASILGLMYIMKMDGRIQGNVELEMMEKAVEELDEKIKLVMNYTNRTTLSNTLKLSHIQ
jgi:PAS domain-containing protein